MTYGMRSFHFCVSADRAPPLSLTDGIATVRQMFREGKSTAEIALFFDVKPCTVSAFMRRHNLVRRSNKCIGKVFQERPEL
mgnify:CR=1 FL=1